nr:unnamed protein product [Digitaria exilis]
MAAAASGRGNLDEEASAPGADLYAVLGLNRECTDAELRGAYRKLAMIWHPDRCSASGSSARVEEAKERFQEIQGAYSAVLSDSNKRFLYDVGVYDSEDDEADLSGMGDFLGEMADMMSQATPTVSKASKHPENLDYSRTVAAAADCPSRLEIRALSESVVFVFPYVLQESFEELQQLFVDMFQDDLDPGLFTGLPTGRKAHSQSPPSTSSSPVSSSTTLRPPPHGRNNAQAPPTRSGAEKRGSPAMPSAAKRPRPGWVDLEPDFSLSGFCFMVSSESKQMEAPWKTCEANGSDRRSGRKPRLSTSRDVAGDGAAPRSRQSQSSSSWPWWQ